jgi:AcrR family transcriptional regulator
MTIIEDRSEDVGLRERKKLQTRNAIHDAAFRLIEANGLEGTTVEHICQEADVSTRTFFNYYSSKAAAALEFRGTDIDPAVETGFLNARGGLVAALCVAIASSVEVGPNRAKMKQLITQRPELLTTVTQMMLEIRSKIIDLAAQRAASREQAEAAVTLVMAALNRVMHDEVGAELPLADRLRSTVDQIVQVHGAQLVRPSPA